ncbi:Midasin, partial [Cryptosporidium felis]
VKGVAGELFPENQILNLGSGLELGPFRVGIRSGEESSDKTKEFSGGDFSTSSKFTFDSDTTLRNISSIIRSMSIMKPILLEGAPGIGKTAIILTLSRLVGVRLHRINMSEQTDFSDLFGCEVPVSGNNSEDQIGQKEGIQKERKGLINWMDGILLYAMKKGDWVILDELNLATQQILEGLNSVMDHRRNIYIPEIGQTIVCHENFRIFATQNPVRAGNSGRKGLPQSFLNRFVKISIGKLNFDDYFVICKTLFGSSESDHKRPVIREEIIRTCIQITKEIENHSFKDGGSWEWNLRDLIRLFKFIQQNLKRSFDLNSTTQAHKAESEVDLKGRGYSEKEVIKAIYQSLEVAYLARLRDLDDLKATKDIILRELQPLYSLKESDALGITCDLLNYRGFNSFDGYLRGRIGNFNQNKRDLMRRKTSTYLRLDFNILPSCFKKQMVSIVDCVTLGENVVLTCEDDECVEKVIKGIQNLSGDYFEGVPVNQINILPSIDANDLIGGYQQYNDDNLVNEIINLFKSIEINVDFEKNLERKLEMFRLGNLILARNQDLIPAHLSDYLKLMLEENKKLNNEKIRERNKEIISNIESKIKVLYDGEKQKKGLDDENIEPKFQFVFSTLINSIKNGDWVVIKNIQNCSSALLDRLNSLLEDKDNDLFIIESGIPQFVKRHKDFRIFFVNNRSVQNSFISNALLNRCVDIFINKSAPFSKENGLQVISKEVISPDEDLAQPIKHALEGIRSLISDPNSIAEVRFHESDVFNKIMDFGNTVLGCDKCLEEIVQYILKENAEYNRRILDFARFYCRIDSFDDSHLLDENLQQEMISSHGCRLSGLLVIYFSSILLNGVSGYLESGTRTRSKMSKSCSCLRKSEIFKFLNEHKERQLLLLFLQSINERFFSNWMRSLFTGMVAKGDLKVGNKDSLEGENNFDRDSFSELEILALKSFRQLGLIQASLDSGDCTILWFCFGILRLVNLLIGSKTVNSVFYSYYKCNILVFCREIGSVFREVSIQKYNHIKEDFRLLLCITLRTDGYEEDPPKLVQDLFNLNYLFAVYLYKEILECKSHKDSRVFQDMVYFSFLVKKLGEFHEEERGINGTIWIKIKYIQSALAFVSKLFSINLEEGPYFSTKDDKFIQKFKALELFGRRNIKGKLLSFILSLILSPIIRLNHDLVVSQILKYSNAFSFTINEIAKERSKLGDIKSLVKHYIYDRKSVLMRQIQFREEAMDLEMNNTQQDMAFKNESVYDLLECSEYFSLEFVEKILLEYLETEALAVLIEDGFGTLSGRSRVIDTLKLFELLQSKIFTLRDESSAVGSDGTIKGGNTYLEPKSKLSPVRMLELFNKYKSENGIYDTVSLLKLKLENKDRSIDKFGNISRVVPRNKSYLDLVYNSQTFTGGGVVVSYEYYNLRRVIGYSDSWDFTEALKFLILKGIDFKSVLQYFTQLNLCGLEFLDQLFGPGNDSLWSGLISQIRNFNEKVFERFHGIQEKENRKFTNSSFSEFYLNKQYLRSQLGLLLLRSSCSFSSSHYRSTSLFGEERLKFLGYLQYLYNLCLNESCSQETLHLLSLISQGVQVISVYDSYSMFREYLEKRMKNKKNGVLSNEDAIPENYEMDSFWDKDSGKEICSRLEMSQMGHLMHDILELDILNGGLNVAEEDSFDFGALFFHEGTLLELVKEESWTEVLGSSEEGHQEGSFLVWKEFEHLVKLLFRFEVKTARLLFLNSLYSGLINFQFKNITKMTQTFLNLSYFLNNQEMTYLEDKKGDPLKKELIRRAVHILIGVIFDFLDFVDCRSTCSSSDGISLEGKEHGEKNGLIELFRKLLDSLFSDKSLRKDGISGTKRLFAQFLCEIKNEFTDDHNMLSLLEKFVVHFDFIFDLASNSGTSGCLDLKALFELLVRTSILVLGIPVYYHCRNLLYIDENATFSDYQVQVKRNRDLIYNRFKRERLAYYHHYYPEFFEAKGSEFTEGIRHSESYPCNGNKDKVKKTVVRGENLGRKSNEDKWKLVALVKEVLVQIMENDLVVRFTSDSNVHSKDKISNFRKLENLIILIKNILTRNYHGDLFQKEGEYSYLYGDVLNPVRFLLNSLLFGMVGYFCTPSVHTGVTNGNQMISFFENLSQHKGSLEKPVGCDEGTSITPDNETEIGDRILGMGFLIDKFEYQNKLGIVSVKSKEKITSDSNGLNVFESKSDKVLIGRLWISLLEVGNYIYDYNNEFLSLYNKLSQEFEYSTDGDNFKSVSAGTGMALGEKDSQEKQSEGNRVQDYTQEEYFSQNNENQLVFRNEGIEKFIEKNKVLEELNLVNKIVSQKEEVGKKHRRINYICLKLMDILILRNGCCNNLDGDFIQKLTDSGEFQFKEYLLYNITYEEAVRGLREGFENGDGELDIWRFMVMHLNRFQAKGSYYNSLKSSYHHARVHLPNQEFEEMASLVTSGEEKGREDASKDTDSELRSMIWLVEEIDLISRLRKIASQVESLLKEYPSQPILIMIKDVIEKIISMNVNEMDLVKLVCYLEVLLMRLLKWQEYVKEGLNLNLEVDNRILVQENNVRFLESSICRLRKLQIDSWPRLVFKVYQKYNILASFSFGDLLVLISKILDYQEFNHNLVYHELVNYLENSTRGEFPIRFLFIAYILDLIGKMLAASQLNTTYVIPEDSAEGEREKEEKLYPNLRKLGKILSFIVECNNEIFRQIKRENGKLLSEFRSEVGDIIKLSNWDVKEYLRIKKSIIGVQKQLKKCLTKFDESLQVKIGSLVASDGDFSFSLNLYPRLRSFVLEDATEGEKEVKDEKEEAESSGLETGRNTGIRYIIKVLSDGRDDNKMVKQRYYKTLIDVEAYGLEEKLKVVENLNDLYLTSLESYLNQDKSLWALTGNASGVSMGGDFESGKGSFSLLGIRERISKSFIILDRLRRNETNGKYGLKSVSQSLIKYNRLLSIGSTFLEQLTQNYQRFRQVFISKYLIYQYLVKEPGGFWILTGNQGEKFRTYVNSVLGVYDLLDKMMIILSSDRPLKPKPKKGASHLDLVIQDKVMRESAKREILLEIKDKIMSGRLLEIISELRRVLLVSDIMNGLNTRNLNSDLDLGFAQNQEKMEFLPLPEGGKDFILVGREFVNGALSSFNGWLKLQVGDLVELVELRLACNVAIFELKKIQDLTENLPLLVEAATSGATFLNKIMGFGRMNIFLMESEGELTSEFGSEYKSLVELSVRTLDYIQAMYLLLENDFFDICEKRQEEGEEQQDGNGESQVVDWRSGCGFSNKENSDYPSKDISAELNNDDSLLEGLKGEEEQEQKDEGDKDPKKGNGKEDPAVDTEMDFSSKLEDFEKDDLGEDEKDQEQTRDEDETERVFDQVDLGNKNSKIDQVEDFDTGKEDKGEGEERRDEERIETKRRKEEGDGTEESEGDDGLSRESDIVAGARSDEQRGNSEDEDSGETREKRDEGLTAGKEEQEDKEEINELPESDSEVVFEYDAKRLESLQGEGDEEDQGEDQEMDNISVAGSDFDDLDLQSEASSSELRDFSCEEGSFQGEDSPDTEMTEEAKDGEIDDVDRKDGIDLDKYQSQEGDNSGEFDDLEQENECSQDFENPNFSSGGDNRSRGGAGNRSDAPERRREDRKEVHKKTAVEEDDAENSHEGEGDLEQGPEEDTPESGIGAATDRGQKGDEKKELGAEENNESWRKETKEGPEDGEEAQGDEEMVNPLLEDNLGKNEDWLQNLSEIIIRGQADNSDLGFNFDPDTNFTDCKVDRVNDEENSLVQNLPSSSSQNPQLGKEEMREEEAAERERKKGREDSILDLSPNLDSSHESGPDRIQEREDLDLNLSRSQLGEKRREKTREPQDGGRGDVKGGGEDTEEGRDDLQGEESGVFKEEETKRAGERDAGDLKDRGPVLEGEERPRDVGVWVKMQQEIAQVVDLLSSQLSIILEPTIRGKMEGGFKTGKKLSMKRVISYIASDYRKDKIWLRRSKPSKREFNILMCIDNSQSMTISRSEYMALQSLFIIIQSFQRIEAGNFGVCSFTGENIKELVKMTNHISSADAINLLSRFSFSEESQDSHQNSIPNILKYSTDLLQSFGGASFGSGGDKQCHRLILIITDGRFNKSKVGVWVNYAIQNNCIPVLIIIDNAGNQAEPGASGLSGPSSSSSSIFNMKSVTKDETGKMIVTPYLESFPFPYYSVIQDPKKLPGLLCELIKQWFELVCS